MHGLVLLVVEIGVLAAHIDEIPRETQIPRLVCRLVQAGKREFDLRVPIGAGDLAVFITEIGIETVGHAARDLQRLLVAGDLPVGHAGLDVVAHHIHLVALLNL